MVVTLSESALEKIIRKTSIDHDGPLAAAVRHLKAGLSDSNPLARRAAARGDSCIHDLL